MDLRLYFRVLWRFRLVLLLGITLGFCLAVLSITRVTLSGGISIAYRDTPAYRNAAVLLISQPGFAEGRAVPYASDGSFATDREWLSDLAYLYTEIANSDRVVRLFGGYKRPPGTIAAEPQGATTPTGRDVKLPLLTIHGLSDTPEHAVAVTSAGVRAFLRFLKSEQDKAEIPAGNRVLVQVLRAPRIESSLRVGGPRKTIPAMVFMTVLFGTVVLAFVLENLRPRLHLIQGTASEVRSEQTRRSA